MTPFVQQFKTLQCSLACFLTIYNLKEGTVHTLEAFKAQNEQLYRDSASGASHYLEMAMIKTLNLEDVLTPVDINRLDNLTSLMDKLLLVSVPSLNIKGGLHRVIVKLVFLETEDDHFCQVYDPNYQYNPTEGDRKVYSSHVGELIPFKDFPRINEVYVLNGLDWPQKATEPTVADAITAGISELCQPGSTVYYVYSGKVQKTIVHNIKITINSKGIFEVVYICANGTYYPSDIFKSKEELIASLQAEADKL